MKSTLISMVFCTLSWCAFYWISPCLISSVLTMLLQPKLLVVFQTFISSAFCALFLLIGMCSSFYLFSKSCSSLEILFSNHFFC
jgi:hypothetical protein